MTLDEIKKLSYYCKVEDVFDQFFNFSILTEDIFSYDFVELVEDYGERLIGFDDNLYIDARWDWISSIGKIKIYFKNEDDFLHFKLKYG